MESPLPRLLILADAPDAFVELFGVSLLERLLRALQRIGFREAIILSATPDDIAAHLAPPSWARAEISLTFRAIENGLVAVADVATGGDRTLVVSAGFYYDARLLKALADQTETALLNDSTPPPGTAPFWRNKRVASPVAAMLKMDWLNDQQPLASFWERLVSDFASGPVKALDAAAQPTYVTSLRKHVRPVFFPAPTSELVRVAEQFPRDLAQNGVLDFPGFCDSPIEDWIVRRLCRTQIRPNQITLVTILIGLIVTGLFATGHLWWGVALAYAIEVLDGVDGKLARTKVETTAAGEWEHETDYVVEFSWWTALAFHFQRNGLQGAWALLALYVGSDLLDRLAKRAVKQKVGRNLDDVSNLDRFVRCIGARRNINIWILIAALALADAPNGFVLICWWMTATAVVHLARALQIRSLSNSTG